MNSWEKPTLFIRLIVTNVNQTKEFSTGVLHNQGFGTFHKFPHLTFFQIPFDTGTFIHRYDDDHRSTHPPTHAACP